MHLPPFCGFLSPELLLFPQLLHLSLQFCCLCLLPLKLCFPAHGKIGLQIMTSEYLKICQGKREDMLRPPLGCQIGRC